MITTISSSTGSHLHTDFHIPRNAQISIEFDKNKSIIVISHPDFIFKLHFFFSRWSRRIDDSHPRAFILLNEFGQEFIHHFRFDCKFEASFNFPDQNVESFQDYYIYAKSIKELIQIYWDYELYISNLPNSKLYNIEYKIDKILDRIPDRTSE
ncbi:MAG: hypothetical protein HeimC3_26280 [Candidatus Heimdallarchaeota archaeon LC_3]|nr:MAG: hypothetical protein HeimC3_26280 [Candidatus Heimdallarchaeota archaeon LC_3]